MFNLPTFTWVSITGVIGFWVIYTLAFLWVSRTWARDDAEARDDH